MTAEDTRTRSAPLADPELRDSDDPAALLAVAVEVARAGSRLARRMRERGVDQVATKTTDTDIVTAADREVERRMVEMIRRRRPHDAILGEELGASGDQRARVRWVMDPIDGTANYLYGLPWYAVSVAAEVEGVAVAGVVRNAATDDEWTAVIGQGAWRNGRRLTGSPRTQLSQALVATGFSYLRNRRTHQAAVIAGLLDRVRDVRRFGAAAIDLCLAAEGAVDAYFEEGLQPWDWAAGALIASEAGLIVSGLNGARPGPRMIIAAPPALFDQLHERLRELVAGDELVEG